MKRIVTRIGIGLSVFAFVALMILIVLPALAPLDSLPVVKTVIQALFCKPGETLTASYSTFQTPGTTRQSTDLQCVNGDGPARHVGQDFIKAVFIGYLVTFLGGLAIVGIAQYLPTRQAGPTPSQSFHENRSTEGHIHTYRHEPVSGGTASHLSLTYRLAELKSALDAGLITQAEYDAKRAEVLKEA
jgi:Short C-terminal domain